MRRDSIGFGATALVTSGSTAERSPEATPSAARSSSASVKTKRAWRQSRSSMIFSSLASRRNNRRWKRLLAAAAFSQRFGGRRGFGGFSSDAPESEFPKNAEFHFLRVEYNDGNGGGFGFGSRRGRASGWWGQDWPDAEEHFTKGVQRLTRMDAGNPEHVSLTDEKLFDYPWIYATQTGWWGLSDAEIKCLR